VSPVKNWLKVVWLDRPWLTHQAQAFKKLLTIYSFKSQQAFTVLKRLVLNPLKFAASIMNVDNKWQSTF
jgi:hypothetical protein